MVDENEDSDAEKYSGTDSDDKEEKPATPKTSPKAEVRKRKARKAE